MVWDKVNFNPAQQIAVIKTLQPQSHLEDSEQRSNKQCLEEESRRNQVKNSKCFMKPLNVTIRRSLHFHVHYLC